MPHKKTSDQRQTANPGYAAFQIAKALSTAEAHDDAATRERAREKAAKWTAVLEGMLSGKLAVGTRRPMGAVPVWATPEVVTGGFVTGRLLASGPLLPHESELAQRLSLRQSGVNRQALNAHFLTEAGLAELTDRLRSGAYDIQVPEEGAFLVMAWLVANGHAEEARELIDELAPHFARLRFYPVPTQRAASFGARVFLENAGLTLKRIQAMKPRHGILAEREAIQVWTPLYDQMIQLFLETVNGDIPNLAPDAAGRVVSPDTKRFNITGGWPCQRYAVDWSARARAVVTAVDDARRTHKLCGKPARSEDSFARLHGYLKRCAENSRALNGRDVGRIRLILARHVAKRGAPGSEKFRGIRRRQLAQVVAPMHHQIAAVLQHRLAAHPADGGIEEIEGVIQPVTNEEANSLALPVGTTIPASLSRKAARCLSAPVDVLVARNIVTSGETLARVIPQFTSWLRAHAFDDPHLRTLYASIYRAFRRRRSLLLLNLETQVRIEELPWVAAIEKFLRNNLSARDLSRQTLKDVAILTLRAFPHAIIPNKLLQEFNALAKGAELNLPFVEELAADIFMDDFSPKFTEAAKHAAEALEGSLYARYYGLDCASVRALPQPAVEPRPRSWFGFGRQTPANPFAALCVARAGTVQTTRWDVARNGMVIEQSQILTTHNLAVLFRSFGLAEELRPELRAMAERCFRWICRRQQAKSDRWHAKLIMLKNTAYAWRQMIFYLSHLPEREVGSFIQWAGDHLREQSLDFQTRFAPGLRGLALVHSHRPLEQAPDVRRFLGWTQKTHWLLGNEPGS